jgi:hypothetical protein
MPEAARTTEVAPASEASGSLPPTSEALPPIPAAPETARLAPPAPESPAPPAPEAVQSSVGDEPSAEHLSFPAELQEEAAQRPDGWVYELLPDAKPGDWVPPEQISRAWKIGPEGAPTGEYVENRHPRPLVSGRGVRSKRRRRLAVALLGLVVIAIAAAAAVVLANHHNSSKSTRAPAAAPRPPVASAPSRAAPAPSSGTLPTRRPRRAAVGHRPPAARNLKLVLLPTSRIWVCLQAQDAQLLIDGQVLTAPSETYTGRAFRLFVGKLDLGVEVNGHVRSLPTAPLPGGYSITAGGVRPLGSATATPCA